MNNVKEYRKQYCKKHMYDYAVLPLICKAFNLDLLDIRKISIWMRCKEVFG